MPTAKLPYVFAYGYVTKTLEKIKDAQTPDRFTQDFISTRLAIKSKSARQVIPFLKRTGFLGSDGAPTDLYKRFRNKTQTGAAAAEALKVGYAPLYEMNEYVHDLNDGDLKGLIVQLTGSSEAAATVRSVVGSFKGLRAFADFDAPASSDADGEDTEDEELAGDELRLARLAGGGTRREVRLGYTINLHLPPTSDIAVFHAIFKSLREHILD